MNRKITRATALTIAGLTALSLAACSSSDDEAETSAAPAAEGATDLSGVCPSTVVFQTDWNPEAEHGQLYNLFGDDYKIDAEAKSVSGPLTTPEGSTGINIEVLAGGPAIGYQTVSSQLYSDDSIMLGYVNSDEAIITHGTTPTVAVTAPLEISPQMIMWDPDTYDATTIADVAKELKADGGVIRYFDGTTYMSYLVQAGIVPESIVDGSYDGTPANFVAAGGKDAQQGYITAEPYIYQNEVADWGKPITGQLIHDTGYEIYQGALAGKPETIQENSKCLAQLVPILQQSQVDYLNDPTAANDLILKLVEEYNTGWEYSQGVADYAVATMKEKGIVGNGSDDTTGNFDMDRLNTVVTQLTDLFADSDTPVDEGLKAEDIATNDYIDTSISAE